MSVTKRWGLAAAQEAVAANLPVVILESTVIAQGLPWPENLETDLDELARSYGAVLVCSGFKSILDMAATLEALETRGLAIVGHRTTELPAFTSVSSGLALEHRVDSPAEAASIVRAHRTLGLPGAVVLVNPVPAGLAVDRQLMESALETALRDAGRQGIGGKDLTPFLLESIREATAGQSLRANRALLVANARLAAQVAVALHQGDAGAPNTDRGR